MRPVFNNSALPLHPPPPDPSPSPTESVRDCRLHQGCKGLPAPARPARQTGEHQRDAQGIRVSAG